MSATSRLWNILRAQLRHYLDRLPPRFRASSGEPYEAGWRAGGAAGTGSSQRRSSQRRSSGPRAGGASGARDPVLTRYYANLEVPYGSDLETVEKAWKRLLRKYHPDLHASDPERQRLADDLVKELNRAYAELRRRLEKKSA